MECPVAQEHKRLRKLDAAGRASNLVSDLNLYHWAPASRQKQILRYGLVPGKRNVTREWKPPYVCFADDVLLAWNLSGAIHPEIPTWDLWQVYPASITSTYEIIFDTYETGRHFVKEYRLYNRIYKKDVHYLASRSQTGAT